MIAILNALWIALRQPQTLPTPLRVPFSLRTIGRGCAETLRNRVALGYTLGVALRANCVLSVCASFATRALGGHPPLAAFVGFMLVCFFLNGLLFGNFSASAMQPLGHIAGVASAIIGSVSGSVALALGTLFGRAYDGTVLPLVAGFTAAALLALGATEFAEYGAAPDERRAVSW